MAPRQTAPILRLGSRPIPALAPSLHLSLPNSANPAASRPHTSSAPMTPLSYLSAQPLTHSQVLSSANRPTTPTLSLSASIDPAIKMGFPPAPSIAQPRRIDILKRSLSHGREPSLSVQSSSSSSSSIALSSLERPHSTQTPNHLPTQPNAGSWPMGLSPSIPNSGGRPIIQRHQSMPPSYPASQNTHPTTGNSLNPSRSDLADPFTSQCTENSPKRQALARNTRPLLTKSISYPSASKQASMISDQLNPASVVTDASLERLLADFHTEDLGDSMDPPANFSLELHFYQKQALYWMHHRELLHTSAPNLGDEIPVPSTVPSSLSLSNMQTHSLTRAPIVHISSSMHSNTRAAARGGILADEQGMGKTIQMIALIVTNPYIPSAPQASPERSHTIQSKATLIICPLTTMDQWAAEIRRSTAGSSLSIYLYHSNSRRKDPSFLADFDVIITTYSTLAMEHSVSSVEEKSQTSIGQEELAKKPSAPLECVHWHRVILDEAHIIKDRTTRSARAAGALEATYRWCVTGTPLQNKLDDIFSLIQFLRLEPYGRMSWWNQYITKPIRAQDVKGLTRLHSILQSILLRRTKDQKIQDQAIVSMSPKIVKIHRYAFNQMERDFYDKLWASSRNKFDSYTEAGTVFKNYNVILELLLRLRQACDHPVLCASRQLKPIAKTETVPDWIEANNHTDHQWTNVVEAKQETFQAADCPTCFSSLETPQQLPCGHFVCEFCYMEAMEGGNGGDVCEICKNHNKEQAFGESGLPPVGFSQVNVDVPELAPTDRERSMDALMKSTKISALMKELYRLRQDDRSIKSIVFSQWTGMLNLVETALQGAGILFARLDGNMSQAQRESSIRLFKTDSETSVILISLKAGGLGLNLPEASRVFMLDPWWNPAAEEQAIDRVHRLNQTRPVMVIRFIIQDSIEDKILELQEKKRLLAHGALSRNPSELRQLRLEDLKLLFS
eukprot:TRINITY_DN1753_c0_g1_i1.p1 TRINITY_DN1753_c0_g1~~TRINITY_DN1753_c0_g1_i1.p1  ORF type:complete len:1009 (-),score=189.43 TRINITY_DN1753_c0_g1_i1:1390-4266(-)